MVDEYVRGISSAYKNVSVDNYVIMPNHIHLLLRLEIHNGPARCPAPTQPLPKIVSAFKSLTTRTAGRPLWQRGYYEHVVRGDYDYERIWRYIDDNPAKWPEDEYYTPETTT
jgi:REP element-mobilizing transposase RayT